MSIAASPVTVLVIPDGASEPYGPGHTSLERTAAPTLNSMCAAGAVGRVATTPPGLPAGSETGIPLLLGYAPRAPVGRGWVEAAASGIEVPTGARPWRVDALTSDGRRADAADTCRRAATIGAHHLRGHRMLVVAAEAPLVPDDCHLWDGGESLPTLLDHRTVVVCGPGAAAGCARLLGAEVVSPPGATGGVVTALDEKAEAALVALSRGARLVVVHVAAPDEASHARDPCAKIEALAALDRHLLAPLMDALAACGGRLCVCPDHGADPRTGHHDGAPVPAVLWGAGVPRSGPARMTERSVARMPTVAHPFALGTAQGADR